MQTITLISTEHRENGKCNADELYKIIEAINPDVIFEEEIDDDKYKMYYSGEVTSSISLEIKCIKKYLERHNIPHIPVDMHSLQL